MQLSVTIPSEIPWTRALAGGGLAGGAGAGAESVRWR